MMVVTTQWHGATCNGMVMSLSVNNQCWSLCHACVVVLQDFPGVGWAWFAFKFQETNKFAVVDKGKGIGGGAASCAELKPNGGMSWACRWVAWGGGWQGCSTGEVSP